MCMCVCACLSVFARARRTPYPMGSDGDPDTNVTINRQRATESLRAGFNFTASALVDLMAVQMKSLDASRARSSHLCVER